MIKPNNRRRNRQIKMHGSCCSAFDSRIAMRMGSLSHQVPLTKISWKNSRSSSSDDSDCEGSKPIFDRPELKAALNRPLEEEIGKKHKYDKRGRSTERSPYYKRHRSRSTSSERKHRYRSTDDGEKRGRRRSSSRDRYRHVSEKRKHQRETSVNKNRRSQSPSTSHKNEKRRSRSRSSSSSNDSDDYKKQIAKPSRNRDYHQDYNIPPEQWMMRPRMFIPHPYPPPPMMYPPMMAPYRPRFPPRPRPPAKQ